MAVTANALPTKRFFVESATRDLSVEDAILDLVDNAVDALIRTKGIVVDASLLRAPIPQAGNPPVLVSIELTTLGFSITDKCGGIPLARAKDHAFRFGNDDAANRSTLGVYGIGMKRALFKLGKDLHVESRTTSDGFTLDINVEEWLRETEDWTFVLEPVDPAQTSADAGTFVQVHTLNDEVLLRLEDPTLMNRLRDQIAMTYSLFLSHFVSVQLNGERIVAKPIPVGTSESLPPAHEQVVHDQVTCDLLVGLAARKDGEWNVDRAGWYVLCNGRVVVSADKTELTGWGVYGPQFVSKFRGFVGVAFFFATDPALLPWTTTKRGLHLESRVYQLARKAMNALARPVLSFLNKMYPGDVAEAPEERLLTASLAAADVSTAVSQAKTSFRVTTRKDRRSRGVSGVWVRYKALDAELDRVRRHLDRPEMVPSVVGRFVLDYYLKTECPE